MYKTCFFAFLQKSIVFKNYLNRLQRLINNHNSIDKTLRVIKLFNKLIDTQLLGMQWQ